MTTGKPRSAGHRLKAEKRRGKRFPVTLPIEVRWRGTDGKTIKDDAIARQVNAQGGLLQMRTYPEASRVELVNLLYSQTAEARILDLRRSREGEVLGVAVELVVPSDSFWGVKFQLKKTNAELHKLEEALKSGGVDLRLLKEFRDAADYVHQTAGAIEELRECHLHGRDTEKVLTSLTFERIRRATRLLYDLAADFDDGRVTHRTQGMADLCQIIEQLHQRLKLASRYAESEGELATRSL